MPVPEESIQKTGKRQHVIVTHAAVGQWEKVPKNKVKGEQQEAKNTRDMNGRQVQLAKHLWPCGR